MTQVGQIKFSATVLVSSGQSCKASITEGMPPCQPVSLYLGQGVPHWQGSVLGVVVKFAGLGWELGSCWWIDLPVWIEGPNSICRGPRIWPFINPSLKTIKGNMFQFGLSQGITLFLLFRSVFFKKIFTCTIQQLNCCHGTDVTSSRGQRPAIQNLIGTTWVFKPRKSTGKVLEVPFV